jgi:hypothetical protein
VAPEYASKSTAKHNRAGATEYYYGALIDRHATAGTALDLMIVHADPDGRGTTRALNDVLQMAVTAEVAFTTYPNAIHALRRLAGTAGAVRSSCSRHAVG